MLAHRLRRRPNIGPTLGLQQKLVFPKLFESVSAVTEYAIFCQTALRGTSFQRTLYHVQQSYGWPGMYIDIKHVLARYGTRRLFNTHKPHVELGRMPVAYYPHRT